MRLTKFGTSIKIVHPNYHSYPADIKDEAHLEHGVKFKVGVAEDVLKTPLSEVEWCEEKVVRELNTRSYVGVQVLMS